MMIISRSTILCLRALLTVSLVAVAVAGNIASSIFDDDDDDDDESGFVTINLTTAGQTVDLIGAVFAAVCVCVLTKDKSPMRTS